MDPPRPGCPPLAGDAASLADHVRHVAANACAADGLGDALRRFYATTDLPCHQVWRASSADGWAFAGPGTRVLDHASVPDVWIDPDGTHWLAVNDVTPGALATAVASDPASLRRVGLAGLGALRILHDTHGDGVFIAEEGLDLALPAPALAADPDLRRGADGAWELLWLQTRPQDLGATVDPASAAEPHRIVRSVARDGLAFAPPQPVVTPGIPAIVDPTAALQPDGRLLVYASQGLRDTITLHGWTWTPGSPPATTPDATPPLTGVMPDLALTVDGRQRLVLMVPEREPLAMFGRAGFDAAWEPAPAPVGLRDVRNPSLAQAPDGTWWLYFNRVDAQCLADLRR